MVLIVVFCASFFVPARTLIGVKLLKRVLFDAILVHEERRLVVP